MVTIRSREKEAYEHYAEAKSVGFILARGDLISAPLIEERMSMFPGMNPGREKALCEKTLWELHCAYVQCMRRVCDLGKTRNTRNDRMALFEEFIDLARATIEEWTEKYRLLAFELLPLSLKEKRHRGAGGNGKGYSQAI